ncbi:hypothetical protein ES707_11008 [subsurface metagenome]
MKDNKLLAKYLGIPYFIDEDDSGKAWLDHNDQWHPESNWNQLMMVVEKIEEDKNVVLFDIHGNQTNIYYYWGEDMAIEGDTKIEAVYNACVKYIKNK